VKTTIAAKTKKIVDPHEPILRSRAHVLVFVRFANESPITRVYHAKGAAMNFALLSKLSLATLSTGATFVALALALASPAKAGERRTPLPDVPATIRAPAGHVPYMQGHAIGTQNYICLPSGDTFKWTLFTPQATLFNRADKQTMTHYFSIAPGAADPAPTWQHSRDTSAVWATLAAPASTDPAYVQPGALPWLLLQVTASQEGPTGGDALTDTTYIHRIDTVGGLAPTSGCSSPANVGQKRFVPYEAEYVFYTTAK
jgi:hypothetical protein